MPPVKLTGDMGSGGSALFNVSAHNVANDATLLVTFDYKLRASIGDEDRVFRQYRIDGIEYLVVATRIEQESDGMHLPEHATIVAAGSAHLLPDGSCEQFSGRGSIVLPLAYFEAEAHRTWTLVLRTRSCQNGRGDVGDSRVLSAEFLYAPVMRNIVFHPRDIQVILDGMASEFRVG